MPPPKVSIIITCYNYGRFLKQAIESAIAQTYPDVEIVVIDDGSTDGTSEVAKRFGPRIHYFYQKNSGVARARNLGVDMSHGEFLNFLDADDWLAYDKVGKQLQYFENDPTIDVVACGRYDVDENGEIMHAVSTHWRSAALDHLLNNECFPPHCALVRRSAYLRVGGFCEEPISESWTEDTDFWLRLALTGSKFKVVPDHLCYWRRHSTHVSRSQMLAASYKGFMTMIDRLITQYPKSVSPRRWKLFRCKAQLAFVGRTIKAKDFSLASKILQDAIAVHPHYCLSLDALHKLAVEAGLLCDNLSKAPTLADLGEALLDILKPARNSGDLGYYRALRSAAFFFLADVAYGRKDIVRAREFVRCALREYPQGILRLRYFPTMTRSLIGPRLGGMVGRAMRGFSLT